MRARVRRNNIILFACIKNTTGAIEQRVIGYKIVQCALYAIIILYRRRETGVRGDRRASTVCIRRSVVAYRRVITIVQLITLSLPNWAVLLSVYLNRGYKVTNASLTLRLSIMIWCLNVRNSYNIILIYSPVQIV